MPLDFLNGWNIIIDKLPEYKAFKKPFQIPLDIALLKKIYFNSSIPEYNDERKALLFPIIDAINKKTNILTTQYEQRNKLGRFYPNKSLSLVCVSRHMKHTYFKMRNWLDLDMCRGHTTIIQGLANKNGIPLPTFKKYIDYSDDIFKLLIEYYGTSLSPDDVKDIFNLSIYGGGITTWFDQMEKKGIKLKTYETHPFIADFICECQTAMRNVYLANPEMVEMVKGELTDEYEIKKRVMSYFCQTIENDIIYNVFKFLEKKHLVDHSNVKLEYDGLCIHARTDDEKDAITSVVPEINSMLLKYVGFPVKMKIKDYKPLHDHSEQLISENTMITDEMEDLFPATDFDSISERFEKTHCKIVENGTFVRLYKNKIQMLSKLQIRTSYEHMTYMKEETTYKKGTPVVNLVERNFIDDWLRNNPKQSCYQTIGCYPNGLECPPTAFNTWTPFDMELITEWEPRPEAVEFILKHIDVLCNYEKPVTDYIIKWIGQLIQYPAMKTNCPVMISKEGAGKTSLMRLIEKMIGSSKYFETADPMRDVWGQFNSPMANTFFVNLNEISKRDTMDSIGKIKALTTDSKIYINTKNVPVYPIDSYHRFFMTTNSEEPITSKKDDRRMIIIRSSDDLIGNKKYFNRLYEYLNDMNVIKSMFEYFREIPNLDTFNSIPLPRTEYQTELQELSVNPIEEWVKDYVMGYEGNEEILKVKSQDLYNDFNSWTATNGIEYNCSNVQFQVRLKRLKIDGIDTHKGNKCYYKLFDIQKMRKQYLPSTNS